jgi:hypothetical protein
MTSGVGKEMALLERQFPGTRPIATTARGRLPWALEVSEVEDEGGRSGPNEPSVRESDFAFAMFYAKFAPASNLRILNTSEYAISSMC